MKQIRTIRRKTGRLTAALLTALTTLALTGCVHDFPTLTPDGETGIDPTLVQVSADVYLDLALLPLEAIAPHHTRAANPGEEPGEDPTLDSDDDPGYRRRFIIEAWRDGKPEARQVTVLPTPEEPGEDPTLDSAPRIALPVSLKLHAVEYTLVIWTDYVEAGTDADLYYNTQDLQYISCRTPYTGSTDWRDCLYGTAPLDLRPYRDQWNAHVDVPLDLVRPLAKYQVIATDVDYFLFKTKKRRTPAPAPASGNSPTGTGTDGTPPFTITFSYSYFVPTVFNALTGKPCDYASDIAFTTPLLVTDNGSGECTIGTDYVFTNGTESSLVLTLEIYDADGTRISRTLDLPVPYRRGCLTTLRGKFLTNEMEGGVAIDPDYEGDIEVDIDDLLK